EPLAALLETSREPSQVAVALRALAEADRDRALSVALPLVRNVDPAIAAAAVEAIGQLPSSTLRADALFAALEHDDPGVVKLALLELSRGGAWTARALTRVGLALDHDAPDVRKLAAELLGQEGSTASQSLLRARLEREKEPTVREALTAAIAARSE